MGSILLPVIILSTKFKNMVKVSLIEEARSSGNQGHSREQILAAPAASEASPDPHSTLASATITETKFQSYSD